MPRAKLTWKPLLNLRGDHLGPLRGYSEDALIAEITKIKDDLYIGTLLIIRGGSCYFFQKTEEETVRQAEEEWGEWMEAAGIVLSSNVGSCSGGETG